MSENIVFFWWRGEYSSIFEGDRLVKAFETLISCGVKEESLVIWIPVWRRFVEFLCSRDTIDKGLHKCIKKLIQNGYL